jgi:hypothetical protein
MEQKERKLSDDNRNAGVVSCNICSAFYDGFLLSQLPAANGL